MNVYYFDVTGGRHWADFREARDLLMFRGKMSVGDVVFIHLSDFVLALENAARSLLDQQYPGLWQAKEKIVSACQRRSVAPWIVFVSGEPPGTELISGQRQKAKVQLEPCFEKRVGVWHKVERRLNGEKLEKTFGPLVECLEYASTENCQTLIDQVLEQQKGDTVIDALRILWRVFVLAQAKEEDVPDQLRRAHSLCKGKTFKPEYWNPVLANGKLRQEILSAANDKEIVMICEQVKKCQGIKNVKLKRREIKALLESWMTLPKAQREPDPAE